MTAVPFLSQVNRLVIMCWWYPVILGKVKIMEHIDMIKALMLKVYLFNFSVRLGYVCIRNRGPAAANCFIAWHLGEVEQ